MSITLAVESVAIDATNLKWADTVNPGNSHDIKRSTDGVTYNTVGTAAAGATTYEDGGLATGTKYWYKVSEGATDSNIETVWTQLCYQPPGRQLGASLPAAGTGDEPVSGDTFDQAMAQLEGLIQSQGTYSPNNCDVCVDDGRVILDCSSGCKSFRVTADTTINSISILGCGEVEDGTIQFVIPANTTIGICGFPAGFGFSGNECFDAPVSGGPDGRTISVNYSGSASPGARGAGNGPGARAKPPSGTGGTGTGGAGKGGGGRGSPLTITCLTKAGGSNTGCSMACSSDKEIHFQVSGGTQPYVASVNVTGATITNLGGGLYKLVPPTNTAPGTAGTAYVKHGGVNNVVSIDVYVNPFDCNDTVISACGLSAAGRAITGNCTTNAQNLGSGSCSAVTVCGDAGTCTTGSCDARTAGMIAAGCVPCGSSMGGKTFTITDAALLSVNKTLKV